MIPAQRIYPLAILAVLGAFLYGLNGLIIGIVLGYIIGVILPWRL